MKREDVERLLREAQKVTQVAPLIVIYGKDLAALCERWLAVEDAPCEEMIHVGGGTVVAELVLPDVWERLDGKRCRIVPGGGGDEH